MPKSSKQPHYYSPLDSPNLRRIALIEDMIDRWRKTGELFTDDPNVLNTLAEYDTLISKEHPVLSHPLSFHLEDWNKNEPEQEGISQSVEKTEPGEV